MQLVFEFRKSGYASTRVRQVGSHLDGSEGFPSACRNAWWNELKETIATPCISQFHTCGIAVQMSTVFRSTIDHGVPSGIASRLQCHL
jgi:hypothetical protein